MGEDRMKIPNRSLERPVKKIDRDADDQEFTKAIRKSGLLYMYEQCYPRKSSQHN
jgi:hypothetical protein